MLVAITSPLLRRNSTYAVMHNGTIERASKLIVKHEGRLLHKVLKTFSIAKKDIYVCDRACVLVNPAQFDLITLCNLVSIFGMAEL